MKLNDFLSKMEAIAPRELALSFDNVGLLIGPDHDEIKTVLVALDLTLKTAKEAIEVGADLVLTHHPRMFSPIQRILPDDPETAAIYLLIRHGIGHYAAHTNLDVARGGVNDVLCEMLALTNVKTEPTEGVLRVGDLPTPLSLKDFSDRCFRLFGENTRYTGDPDKRISRVAVCGGAGNGELGAAKSMGADAFLTGEVKHSEALNALDMDLGLITAGHYETEVPVLKSLISRLQAGENDVQYKLTHLETSPFCRR